MVDSRNRRSDQWQSTQSTQPIILTSTVPPKLGTAMRYTDRLVKEAIKIQIHHESCNRDEGFNLSHAWRPVINVLQQFRGAPMGKEKQAAVGT
jgi:hypothetical protein